MTRKQLHEFVKAYVPAFPGWILVNNEYFIRFVGPIAQEIGFEALRMGAYRPMNVICILVAPKRSMLHQFLDIRNREVLVTEHDDKKVSQVVRAMEEQFVPSIRGELVPNEVLRLCEGAASERVHDACALSALNAYCGNRERAMEWLDILSRITEQPEQELTDSERRCVEFGHELRRQLEGRTEKAFLDTVRQTEQARLLGYKGNRRDN